MPIIILKKKKQENILRFFNTTLCNNMTEKE